MKLTRSPEEAKNHLHVLLLKAAPANARGDKSILHLARVLPCTPQLIWRWINDEHIPARWAKKVLAISEGRITRKDLNDYVWNSPE